MGDHTPTTEPALGKLLTMDDEQYSVTERPDDLYGTHWIHCLSEHDRCAIAALRCAIAALQAELDAQRREVARLTEDRERLTELRAAVDDWVDARNRLAQIPYRPGSIGHTFVANQVERGVARIDAAYAAVDAARRDDAARNEE